MHSHVKSNLPSNRNNKCYQKIQLQGVKVIFFFPEKKPRVWKNENNDTMGSESKIMK